MIEPSGKNVRSENPKPESEVEPKTISRRGFMAGAAAAGAALTIVPRRVLGKGFTPPSDLLNIAGVGVGGMGRANLIALSSQNIVAMCDIDWGYAGHSLDRLDTDIQKLKTRLEQPNAQAAPGQPEFDRVKAQARLEGMFKLQAQAPKAKRYTDYREMLEKQKDIDAVLVATADHMHASIGLAAMDLGKAVYVQKPLTWCVGGPAVRGAPASN